MLLSKNGRKRKRKTNKGFSLVEVLVCIAIIAIISVPILAGIRTSAKLNYDAHYTQKVTAYAQKELEIIKAVSVQSYEKKMNDEGVTRTLIQNGDVFPDIYAQAQESLGSFSQVDKLTTEEKEALFTPFYFQKEHVEIAGREYVMRVVFSPAPYSRENAAGGELASDINISEIIDLTEADGARYPVISDEINCYDGKQGTVSTVVVNLKNRLSALGIEMTEEEIGRQMEKQAVVEINLETTAGADGKNKEWVTVSCDVTYACAGAELNYHVYNGRYPYAPTQGEKNADASIQEEPGEISGGNVFIFARAFQPEGVAVEESAHCRNVISINGGGDADRPVNVYLIRGYTKDTSGPNKRDYNFDEVNLNGTNFFSYPDYLEKGECPFGEGTFLTNIHSSSWDRNVEEYGEEAEKEKLIGKGSYKARCYQVTVELLDEDGDLAGRVESTKIERQ